jgi:hypothetical protein
VLLPFTIEGALILSLLRNVSSKGEGGLDALTKDGSRGEGGLAESAKRKREEDRMCRQAVKAGEWKC